VSIWDVIRRAMFVEQPKTRREIAVERARRMAKQKTTYILGAGGRDPKASTPLTKRNGALGSDCVGFTSWCLQHDRYQPETFELYDGWINTDSLMMDAKDGKRVRMGHIALVVEVPTEFPDGFSFGQQDRRAWLHRVLVIDCAAASNRKPYAITETRASASWDKADAMFARCVR
jgi:hypothetical protein